MQHMMELKNAPVFTEKFQFEDSLNNQKIELSCDWELNAGQMQRKGDSISKQLEHMGFDASVVQAYENIYSEDNIQSLVMMMFAGMQ